MTRIVAESPTRQPPCGQKPPSKLSLQLPQPGVHGARKPMIQKPWPNPPRSSLSLNDKRLKRRPRVCTVPTPTFRPRRRRKKKRQRVSAKRTSSCSSSSRASPGSRRVQRLRWQKRHVLQTSPTKRTRTRALLLKRLPPISPATSLSVKQPEKRPKQSKSAAPNLHCPCLTLIRSPPQIRS